MNVKEAATEAGSIVGFSEKIVRKYRNDLFSNQGSLTPLKQGKYERQCVYHDEHLNHKAAEWVRANAFVKGRPNMFLPARDILPYICSLAASSRFQACQPQERGLH